MELNVSFTPTRFLYLAVSVGRELIDIVGRLVWNRGLRDCSLLDFPALRLFAVQTAHFRTMNNVLMRCRGMSPFWGLISKIPGFYFRSLALFSFQYGEYLLGTFPQCNSKALSKGNNFELSCKIQVLALKNIDKITRYTIYR